MKTSYALLASALCLGSAAAHAMPNNGFGETYPDFQPQTHSTLTRAAVQAEAMSARRAKTLAPEGEGYDQRAPMDQSTATRQGMETDPMNAHKAGYMQPERSGYEVPPPLDTAR